MEICSIIAHVFELFTIHNYPEYTLVASSLVLLEVQDPKIVPPPGHPQGGGTSLIEHGLVVIYLWLADFN